MAPPPDFPVTFTPLYDSPLVAIHDYVCSACRAGAGPEEGSDHTTLVLLRHGAFCRHVGRRCLTADVNQVAFFPAGSAYRVSHPAEGGDRGTVFRFPPRILRELLQEVDPAFADQAEPALPFLQGPCASDLFWTHRDLVRRLESGGPLEPFWVEVTGLQLAADALGAAAEAQGRPAPPARTGTREDHADLAEAAKAHLATHLGGRLTLDDLAQAVHASPFHLARLFQRHTGTSLHRYLTLLRLRAALERLEQGAEDLTALALDLGFSSHSHFTDAFRREFGCPPSELRKGAARRLRELRRNLEV